MSFSFLRLVKCTRLDFSEGKTYMTSIWYPLQACVKIKRYSPEMVGGEWNQYHRRFGSIPLLNMALVCIRVELGTSHLIFHLPPWVWVILFDHSSALCLVIMTSELLMSNTSKSSVVLPMCSREVDLCSFNPPLILIWSWFTNIMFLCLASMMWETLWPTFDHSHFLSTSAHYPGIWSRDSLLVPWSLHASMAGSLHPM